MKVLAFGEVLFDVYDEKSVIGGAPLNFAAHVVKCGGQASVLSAVGDDELGQSALGHMKKWGVSTECVETLSDYPTGTCIVTLDERSVPSYALTENVAWDHISCKVSSQDDFDVLYLGTLALRNKDNRQAVKTLLAGHAFGDVFADVNIRPPFYCEETLDFVLENATIAKISDEELPVVQKTLGLDLTDDLDVAAKQLSARYKNIRILVITRGGDGAVAYDVTADKKYTADAVKTKVVSTVGAGDSFSAAFLYTYMTEGDIRNSLQFAAQVAAKVVACYGAIPDVM